MIYLIVPCFNEENRLQVNAFVNAANENLFILFADDGSKDRTAEKIESVIKDQKYLSIYKLPQNAGKGEAVRQAYQFLKTKFPVSPTDWFGYWDADLATPLYEIENMKKYSETFYGKDGHTIYASRVHRFGSRVVRSHLRHYLGRAFATAISILLDIRSYDSQCGAKLFNSASADIAFKEPFISRWIFDVEILLRLKQKNIIEYPVMEWQDVPGSKVKVFRESIRVFTDILRIRSKYCQ